MPRSLKRRADLFAALSLLGALSGCATIDVRTSGPAHGRSGWVLLPVQNQTDVGQAGERIEELLLTLLASEKGIELSPYPPSLPSPTTATSDDAKGPSPSEPPLDERQRYERMLSWARDKKYVYAIGGSVQELRYRSGSDGDPAVGLTLRVVDLASGSTLFSASGASPSSSFGQSGSLSAATQQLLRSMLGKLQVELR